MSLTHWPGLEHRVELAGGLVLAPYSGLEADVDVVVVVGQRERVVGARGRSSGEMIWCGFIVPWSVSSRRIVMSVIEPGPWWPRIGMPLIAAMSTALPEECSETLPERRQVAVAAVQRADRRLQAAGGEELERRQHAAVDRGRPRCRARPQS